MLLNRLEEKILRHLVSASAPGQAIEISFENESFSYMIDAVTSLANKGLVKNYCTLSSVEAALTNSGASYFEETEKAQYGAYYSKIQLIGKIISEAEELKTCQDTDRLCNFIRKSFIPFSEQLGKDVIHGFSTSFGLYASKEIKNYHKDLEYLISIFNVIKSDLVIEAQKEKTEQAKISIYNNPTFQNENTVSVVTSIATTIDMVSKTDSLTDKEKQEVRKMLLDIEASKGQSNKKAMWSKVQKALGWLAKKGIEVGVILLPYLVQALQ